MQHCADCDAATVAFPTNKVLVITRFWNNTEKVQLKKDRFTPTPLKCPQLVILHDFQWSL